MILRAIIAGLRYTLFGVAFLCAGIALPFMLLAGFVLTLTDDLEGGWRRGRQQNWLWRLARRARGEA